MAKCGAQHPTDPQRTCMMAPGFHPDHLGISGPPWPNTAPGIAEEVDRIKASSGRRPKTDKRKLAELAAAAAKARIERLANERRAAQRGMQTALEATPADFRESFLAAVYSLAQQRETLTSDDVWVVLDYWGVDTQSRTAVGPLMASAAKHGWTEKTDQRAVSSRPGSKARDGLTVWRSLVFDGSVAPDASPSGEAVTTAGADTSITPQSQPQIWGPSS